MTEKKICAWSAFEKFFVFFKYKNIQLQKIEANLLSSLQDVSVDMNMKFHFLYSHFNH